MRSSFIIGRQSVVAESLTSLEATARDLTAGDDIDLTSAEGMPANSYSDSNDIQWMTVAAYYDPTNKELHYLGKPASGESHLWRHYIFDLDAETWYRPLYYEIGGTSATGHAWQVGFDRDTGNVYVQRNNNDNIMWFDRAAWETAGKPSPTGSHPSYWNNVTSTPPDGASSWASTSNGITVHPNCFGTGDRGIVVAGQFYVYGYRINTSTWYRLSSVFYGVHPDVGGQGNGGGGFYCPSGDYAIVGTGELSSGLGGGPGPAWRVPTGTAADRTTASYGDNTPIPCAGVGGSGAGSGKMIQDPRNLEHLLILRNDTGTIYRSTDYGVTWSSALAATHPFYNMSGATQGWTVAMCNFGSGKNVLIGLTSKSGSFQARMWKPDFA